MSMNDSDTRHMLEKRYHQDNDSLQTLLFDDDEMIVLFMDMGSASTISHMIILQ